MPRMTAGVIDKLVGKRIRAERESQDMTLDELAVRVGVTPQAIHQYELGLSPLTVSRLVIIARALGRKTRFFLEGK